MEESRDEEGVDRSSFLDHGWSDARRGQAGRVKFSARAKVGGFGQQGVRRYRL